jgi:4-alpha-glucanotransferase
MNLEETAARFGIQSENHFIGGQKQEAPPETLERLLAAFGITEETSPPDASFELCAPDGAACFLPENGTRMWGIAAQLYQLRSARNWGIGDLADLCDLARLAGAAGADFVGLNPLHALFLSNPHHCSPFSPSNRRFLNPLYIAVDRVEGFDDAMVDADKLARARAGEFVDYAAVAELKLSVLRTIWQQTQQPPDLDEFRAGGGLPLYRHALFDALSEHLTAQGHGAGWTSWPERWHDVEGAAVQEFEAANQNAIAFHLWLQWLADRQLRAARDACREAGMRIGLYLDFAVGEAPDGSGTWSDRQLVVSGIHVGAPPDYFNEDGQNWGLAPLSPVVMAQRRAQPFGDLIEDATRRAGALRIDHVMALWQLFLIPEGMAAAHGTYARYPMQDMLTALARASQDRRTVIIGEDLGNVPEGFRDVMAAANILSYRILLFERTDAGFIPPDHYPQKAMVCISTHDLPTFQGWWRGDDVALRHEHGLIGVQGAEDQSRARERERRELLGDLVCLDLLPAHEAEAAGPDRAPTPLIAATHRLMARTPALLFAARLEDLAGEWAPVNLPSTTDTYPNWKRKLGVALENLPHTPLFQEIVAGIRAERPGHRDTG